MVDRIVTRIEQAYTTGLATSAEEAVTKGKAMYYKYFRVSIYRNLYKESVDEVLGIDGYDSCVMTEEEISAYTAG